MPFIVTDQPSIAIQTVDRVRDHQLPAFLDEQSVYIGPVSVGATSYPMRRELVGTYVRALEELNVDGISPLIVGKGRSTKSAIDNFCVQFHAAFQTLLHKRQFEMTDSDRIAWKAINEFIDVTVYRNTTPLVVRQFGRIKKARPFPEEIAWENGKTERVTLDKVNDGDFVTYRPGQPFEAVVERDPLSFRLIRIIHIERRRNPRRMDPESESRTLDSIGSVNRLRQDTQWTP